MAHAVQASPCLKAEADLAIPTVALDVIVPTFKRARTLGRTLDSLMAARMPAQSRIHVTVVQNDAELETTKVIRDYVARYPGRISGLSEPRSGKSHALNTGIGNTSGDLVGFVDDDEEIDPGWYEEVERGCRDPGVDFVGGPCLPLWGSAPPFWLPPSWRGVIGFADHGNEQMVFGQGPGMLMGGNAVIRRSVLAGVGRYSGALGPRATRRLFSSEDEDLYQRLLAAGAHGLYLPAMRVYHWVPTNRLTKAYHRNWSFWNGVSKSVLDSARPSPVARIGRVPRYLFGTALRGTVAAAVALRRDPARVFEGQLALLHLLGFLYGSYLYREERR